MIRKMQESDRKFFLETADEFYHTDAVIKPLPLEKLCNIFDEIMRSDIYAEGFILEFEGFSAGYAVTSKCFSTEAGGITVWIEDIYILNEFRGKGLGKEFFSFISEKYNGTAKRFRLEVERENFSAVALYEKIGFEFLPYEQMIKDLD